MISQPPPNSGRASASMHAVSRERLAPLDIAADALEIIPLQHLLYISFEDNLLWTILGIATKTEKRKDRSETAVKQNKKQK